MYSLITKIKEKKELRGLADSFVQQTLTQVLKKNNLSLPLTPVAERIIMKEVRAQLRRHVGQFQTSKDQVGLLRTKNYPELLRTHASTRERLPDYPFFRQKIAAFAARSILDIGCGLNPVALATKGMRYWATDINESDLAIVHQFFKQEGLDGQTRVLDAKTESSFPQADLTLLLKVVDLLDHKGHKRTEQLLKVLNSPHLIISFSTKTLSGKPMNHPQRGWIEHLLPRLGYSFTVWKTKNELYYFASIRDQRETH